MLRQEKPEYRPFSVSRVSLPASEGWVQTLLRIQTNSVAVETECLMYFDFDAAGSPCWRHKPEGRVIAKSAVLRNFDGVKVTVVGWRPIMNIEDIMHRERKSKCNI